VPQQPEKPEPPKPNEPDQEQPKQPEQPKPSEPTTPGKENNNPPKKEEVKTPKKTPVSGKVKVPENKTPKLSEKPKNGKVSIDKNGNWTYTPNKKFEGKDSFTISIQNEKGQEEFITIDVDVIPLDGVTGNGSGSTPSSTGTLPQTGENSSLPIQLLGGAMILSGIALYVRKRKQTLN
jgi:LPXTG-motif cell wall-anchored protein